MTRSSAASSSSSTRRWLTLALAPALALALAIALALAYSVDLIPTLAPFYTLPLYCPLPSPFSSSPPTSSHLTPSPSP